jgi:hypothetical protein
MLKLLLSIDLLSAHEELIHDKKLKKIDESTSV